jgi:hypothetical protein
MSRGKENSSKQIHQHTTKNKHGCHSQKFGERLHAQDIKLFFPLIFLLLLLLL